MGLLQNRAIIPTQENYSIIDKRKEIGGLPLVWEIFGRNLLQTSLSTKSKNGIPPFYEEKSAVWS